MGEKLTILYAGVAAVDLACSVMYYVDYATKKAAVIQEHLSRAPELSDKVLEAANNAAENVGSGNLIGGLAFAGAAGVFTGLALYESAKIRRE